MFFWKNCDLCNLNYQFIGKIETFEKDSKYVMERVGMNTSKIPEKNKRRNLSSGNSTEEMTKYLFSHLPNTLMQKLYDSYKIDFEMFDYHL